MCNCDFVQTDIHIKKLVKTRLPHKCIECNELMPKGTMMYHVKTLIEGYFDRHYTCLDCEAIATYLSEIDTHFCFCYGQLMEALLESYGSSTRDIESEAKNEGIPSATNGVIKGRYSTYRLNAPWLTPRIGGKFKLAGDRNDRQEIALIVK